MQCFRSFHTAERTLEGVERALEHYESIRVRHELEMKNRRLASRLDEIRQLATFEQ